MKTIIMAGGEGTRLRPLTCDIPKPMVNFFDKPLVQYTVEHLKNHGMNEMIFTLMYKPERITEFFEDGSAFGVHIEYSIEDSPLGTAGSVKKALPKSDETVLVISGDALTDIDIQKAYDFHRQNRSKATLVLKKMENPLEYGIVITDDDASIVKFVEKPGWREVFSDAVNTGIYILEPEVLDMIPENKNYDFAKNLFPDMLEKKMKLCGYVAENYWCDVGNIESYIKAHEDVLRGACKVTLKGSNVNGIWVGKDVKISNSALLQAPSFLGDGCVIKDGVKLGMYSCISRNAEVGEYSNLKRSIAWQGSKLGKHVKLSSAIVCDNAFVGPRSNIYEGAVVGRECVLDGSNTLAPRAKIWPSKWLENGTSISENIIWGYGQKKGLFSYRGIAGEMNGTLTAEKLTAAGCAYAAALGKNAKMAVACDGSTAGEAVFLAFVSGLKLSGVKLYDLGEAPLPLLRYYMQISGVGEGAFIKNLSGQKVCVDLLSAKTVYADKARRKKAQSALEYFDFIRPSKEGLFKTSAVSGVDSIYVQDIAKCAGELKTKPLIAIFANDRKTDRLYMSCLKEAGIFYAYVEGENYEHQILNCRADFGIKFYANGEGANFYSERHHFDNADAYMSLVYLYVIRQLKPEELKLPPGMSQAVRDLAANCGISLSECTADEMYRCNGEEVNRFLTDPLYFSVKLAAHLANEGQTLDDFTGDLPVTFTSEREVNCEWKDIGKAIRMLYEANKDAVAVEGIKVYRDHGWGFILPREDEPKISVKAEGFSEEYAKELCDFYTEELKRFIKT